MNELLLFHVANGVGLIGLVLVRLVLVLGLRKARRLLEVPVIISGGLQVMSGVVLMMVGASPVHVCVSAVATVGLVALAEVVMVRFSGRANQYGR